MALTGIVESYKTTIGLSGWGFDPEYPADPLRLGLFFGDTLAVATVAAFPRPDIAGRHPECNGFVGFRFSPIDFLVLATLEGVPDGARASVRVLPSGEELESSVPLPTRAEALAACEAALADSPSGAGAPAYGSLAQRLHHYRRVAACTTFAPRYKQVDGFIETVTGIGDDYVLLSGWMKAGQRELIEAPGFFFVEDRISCGVSLVSYEHQRTDLESGARQFLAVTRGAWTPAPDSRLNGGLHVAGNAPMFLLASDKLAYLPANVHDSRLRAAEAACERKAAEVVRQFRSLVHHSGYMNASQDAGPVRFGFDRLVAVPGFGFVASGWLLLGRERLRTMELRHGEALAPILPESLAFAARPDLASAFPRENVDSAGFVGVFLSPDDVVPRGRIELRLGLAGGRMFVAEVDPALVTVLRSVGDLDQIGRIYPHIDAEEFGPRLREAVVQHFVEAADIRRITVSARAAESYFLVLLPADEALCRLYLTCVGRLADELPSEIGICLLAAGAGGQRGIRQWLQHDAALAGRASAAYTVPEHFSLHHLPHLHELLPLDRFAMSFGPPVFEEETLARLVAFLKGDESVPSAVVDAGRASGGLKAVAMSRDGLESYLASAPYRFRGEDLAALAEQQYAMVHDDALVLAAETRADTFADRLDEMMRQAEDYRAAD